MSLTLALSAVVFALILFMLREIGFRAAPVIGIIAGVLLLLESVELYGEALGAVGRLASESGASRAVSSMLKVTGLTYLFGIASDVCRELGESGLSRVVDVVGRVEILLVAAPYFGEIIMLGVELI